MEIMFRNDERRISKDENRTSSSRVQCLNYNFKNNNIYYIICGRHGGFRVILLDLKFSHTGRALAEDGKLCS